MRRTWAVVLCVLSIWSAPLARSSGAGAERVALVIGNAGYRFAPLANPGNDARAMAGLLRDAGFRVDEQLDATHASLKDAVRRFGDAIRDPRVGFGLFYYAGHAVQLEWRNYLIPVNAQVRSAEDIQRQTVDVSELLSYMDRASGRNFLVILDACRDNPFGSQYRVAARGLSQFDAPHGSLLAYATAPGRVALDGSGSNGLYTGHLLRELAVRGARLEDVFKRVRLNVRLASGGRQVPWESTSLEEDVVLFPEDRKPPTEDERERLLDRELAAWARARVAADATQLAEFIRAYPSGSLSELAQARLNRLLARNETAPAAVALADAAPGRGLAAPPASGPAAPAPAAPAAAVAPPATAAVSPAAPSLAGAAAPLAPAASTGDTGSAASSPTPPLAADPGPSPDAVARLEPTPYFKGRDEHRRAYRVGQEFRFRVVDGFNGASQPLVMKVTSVDTEADRVVYNGGEYVSDLMGNTLRNRRGGFDTPRQFYPAELHLGKRWQSRFRQARPGGVTYTFAYDLRVAARERITVPAGTFDAWRIEARGWNLELGAALSRTIWVAPGVDADIAHETLVRLRNGNIDQNERQELVSYR